MSIALPARISLCVLSGIGVGLIQAYGLFGLQDELAVYPASGLLFAAGVLYPLLPTDNRTWPRTLGFAITSTASYYSAVWLALDGPFNDNQWVSFTIASVAGAAIVMTAFAMATQTQLSRSFVSSGLVAGLVGGPITLVTLPEDTLLILTGHAIWHSLISLAIYFGAQRHQR